MDGDFVLNMNIDTMRTAVLSPRPAVDCEMLIDDDGDDGDNDDDDRPSGATRQWRAHLEPLK